MGAEGSDIPGGQPGSGPGFPSSRKPAARLAMSSSMNHDEIGVCPGDLPDTIERRFPVRVPCHEGDPTLHATGRLGRRNIGWIEPGGPPRLLDGNHFRKAGENLQRAEGPPDVVPGRSFYILERAFEESTAWILPFPLQVLQSQQSHTCPHAPTCDEDPAWRKP